VGGATVQADPSGVTVSGGPMRLPRGPRPHRVGEASLRGTTGPDGTVRLRGLPAREHTLRVTPPEARKDLRSLTRESWTPADVEVALERGYVIRGIVRDAGGKPLANVTVMRRQGDRTEQLAQTKTDGTFEVTGLPAGPVVLVARPQGTYRHDLPSVTVDAGAEDVHLVVDAGATLVVRIPMATEAARGSVHGWLYESGGERAQPAGGAFAERDGDAWKLTFPGLKPDVRYTLWIAPQESDWYALATDLGAGPTPVIVRLERGGTIRGRLTLPDGATNVGVSVASEQGLTANGRVAPDGTYEVRGLPPGTWTVRGYARDGQRRFDASGTASTGGSLDLRLEERTR
jgi:hypothetical protein